MSAGAAHIRDERRHRAVLHDVHRVSAQLVTRMRPSASASTPSYPPGPVDQRGRRLVAWFPGLHDLVAERREKERAFVASHAMPFGSSASRP